MLTFGSLFAGVGGFDLGFERAGMRCAWQVEIDDYARGRLERHWPDVPRFRDVRDCGAHNLEPVDIICGGFPCQPYSVAGDRRGRTDDRHLWPEMLRIVQELEPRWVVGENVPGFASLFLDQALADLEGIGYEAWPLDIPAAAVDAKHIRHRIFIVAYADRAWQYQSQGDQQEGREWSIYGSGLVSNPNGKRCAQQRRAGAIAAGPPESQCSRRWAPEPRVGRVADGVPHRVDRLRCLGNAVVPQLAQVLGELIVMADGMAR